MTKIERIFCKYSTNFENLKLARQNEMFPIGPKGLENYSIS